MIDLVRGQFTQAWIVGVARGLAEAIIIGALGAVAYELSVLDLGQLAIGAPFALATIRTLEGVADHIDPTKTRAPTP